LKKTLTTFALLAASHVQPLYAHSGGATLGEDGLNASATGLVRITCFDDGNGEPAKLTMRIIDHSEPVEGLLISAQLYKGLMATNVTDQISGDADYSEGVELSAGPGVYRLILNKTAAGPRRFDVEWHCKTADDIHTGTEIIVDQFQ